MFSSNVFPPPLTLLSGGGATVPNPSPSTVSLPFPPITVSISARKLPSATSYSPIGAPSVKLNDFLEACPIPDGAGVGSKFFSAFPPIDLKETPLAHLVKVELPGMKKTEVKVELIEGRILKISGEKTDEKEVDEIWHHCEIVSPGKFARKFELPDGVQVEKMEANFEDGVLTISVPKLVDEGVNIEISG